MKGKTPLSRAAIAGHEAVVKLLLATNQVCLDHGNRTFPTLFPSILQQRHESARMQSLDDIINAMVANGRVNVNSKDIEGLIPLFHAVCGGHNSIVNLLLSETDAEPNTQYIKGRTALSHSACHDNGILELLLAVKDIEPDLGDRNGRTPLSYAAESPMQSGFELLLSDTRVRPDSKDVSRRTPLSYAAGRKDAFRVLLLLANPEVNPNVTDTSGRTPLSYTAEKGNLECCSLFLADVRVEVDSRDTFGRTSLWYLAKRADMASTKLYSNNQDVRRQKGDELNQIRKLTRELVVNRRVALFTRDTEWRAPTDMMPELLSYERERPQEQRGTKRKAILE